MVVWKAAKSYWPGVLALGAVLLLAGIAMFIADGHGYDIQRLSLRYPGIDKLAHFLTHLTLTLGIYGIARRSWKGLGRATLLAIAVVASLLLGLVDETQQAFVAGREFDLLDLLANVCGTTTGALLLAARQSTARRNLVWMLLPVGMLGAILVHAYASGRYYSTGLLQIHAGDLVGAQRSFLEGIARGYATPALYNELAWLELERLDADPATALWHSALAVAAEPDNAGFLDTHGWALYRAGRYEEALDPLLRAFAGQPDMVCIHYHLGAVYHALGRPGLARTHLLRQLTVSTEGDYADGARALLADMAQTRGGR
ncbi:MAG: VanZ family protein [Thiohalobacteraceae bacterium]